MKTLDVERKSRNTYCPEVILFGITKLIEQAKSGLFTGNATGIPDKTVGLKKLDPDTILIILIDFTGDPGG